jgi:hypothetical protein
MDLPPLQEREDHRRPLQPARTLLELQMQAYGLAQAKTQIWQATTGCHAQPQGGIGTGKDEERQAVTVFKFVDIPLTRGMWATIDLADFERVRTFKWQPHKEGRTWYARNSTSSTTSMHRVIMQATTGQFIDHIDGDGLNNRRSNLRFATLSQNQGNRRLSKNNKSGYKGVSWNNHSRKWLAQIVIQNKNIYLGLFDSIEDARVAYAEAAKRYFGDFMRLK